MALSIVEVRSRRSSSSASHVSPSAATAPARMASSRVAQGVPWRDEVVRMFGGKGSFGNGAAMRAAPIGAYFAPDLDRVRVEALRSAEPTHAHPDHVARH